MNKVRSLTASIGVATLIVVGLACGAGEAPADVGPASELTQAQDRPAPSGSPGDVTLAPTTGGGTPRVGLTYEGEAYHQDNDAHDADKVQVGSEQKP